MRTWVTRALMGLFLAQYACGVLAEERTADFSGEVVRIVVGYSAGGGYDLIARMVSRHLPGYLEGQPQIVVENMPGAGSLKAANYIARVAEPDGLTIGFLSGAPVVAQLLGRDGVKLDARTLEVIASPAPYKTVCAFSRSSGISSLDDWRGAQRTVTLGATNLGSSTHDVPLILAYSLDLPTRVIPGFKGSSNIRLAVDRGDVDGACFAWDSMLSTWRERLVAGEVIPVLKTFPEHREGLDGVPSVQDSVPEGPKRAIIDQGLLPLLAAHRFFALAPETPPGIASAHRKAFLDTFRDAGFLADAKKAGIFVDPIPGEEVAKRLEAVLGLDPQQAELLKTLLVRQ